MPEISANLVLEAVHCRIVGNLPDRPFAGVCTDSRALTPGSLFAALSGERFDGHDFVQKALSRGAAAALVSREVQAAQPLIVVPDTLAALGQIAASYRRTLSTSVIAVTGSTGKTTTKEMIAAILGEGWTTGRSPSNFNNEIGVPLAILGLEPRHRAAVVELAMRGEGQIGYLAEIAAPETGVVTNVGVSHAELLGSREAIAEAKAELLSALPNDGVAVLNADDSFFDFLRERSPCRVVSFGSQREADVTASDVQMSGDGSAAFVLRGWWGEGRVSLRVAGRHQAWNAAAAAAAAMAAGADAQWIAPGLSSFEGADMRVRITRSPAGFTVIDDCYNAAPDSMRVALELLADLPGTRKWAVLGDMKELGAMAPEWHAEVGEIASDAGLTGLITVGGLAHHIAEAARRRNVVPKVVEAADGSEAATLLASDLRRGDVVLIKGSRAMALEGLVRRLVADCKRGEG